MKKYDESNPKVKTEKVYKLDKVLCDKCNKQLYINDKSIMANQCYYHITTHHNRWDEDSVYSYEYYDFCKECAIAFITDYINNAEISDCLEIEFDNPHGYYTSEVDIDK